MSNPKVLVVTTTYNRPNLLRLTTGWLLKDRRDEFTYWIFDDGSTYKDVHTYLEEMLSKGVAIHVSTLKRSYLGRPTLAVANQRCGLARRDVLTLALSVDPPYDYIFLKDDDVLVSSATVHECVGDLQALIQEGHKVGALTLFGLATLGEHFSFGTSMFAQLSYTGEAHVVFDRRALDVVGVHFGDQPKGFADVQFASLKSAGYSYCTRTKPPYQVQHLGVGPTGSVIHSEGHAPFWCVRGYYTEKDHQLEVAGFDHVLFSRVASRVGGELAAEAYLKEKGVPHHA